MALTSLLNRIKDATGITPSVKGGTRVVPITYTYYPVGNREYKFEIDVVGKSIDKVVELAETIRAALVDFADYPQFSDMSVTLYGGGLLENNGNLTQVAYYDIILYENLEDIQYIHPQGTLTITRNGIYNIATKEYVNINVAGGGGDPWEGPYEVTSDPFDDEVLETEGKVFLGDFTVHKIPYEEVDNPSGGKTANIS